MPNLTARKMAKLYESGYSPVKIGQRAGITAAGVRYHLKAMGVKMRPVGNKVGVPKPAPVSKAEYTDRTPKGSSITIGRMREMYEAERQTVSQIAAKSGVSTFTVRYSLRKIGAKMRNRKQPRGLLHFAVPKKNQAILRQVAEALGGTEVQ